jgi:hypothetical protein
MSDDNKEPIVGYSADYRGAHPQKPKVGRPPKRSAPAGAKASGARKKTNSEKKAEPARTAENTKAAAPEKAAPEAEKPRPPRTDSPKKKRRSSAPKAEAPAPLPQENPENDALPADFLPAGEDAEVDPYLSKWDDNARGTASRSKREHRRAGKYRYGLFAGSLVLLLALVGVIFIAVEAGTRIHSAVTDDSKQRAYDSFLSVIVAQDPQPFESPDKADPDFVLNASLWKIMTESGSNYTNYDDVGRTIVPLGDVVDACGALFGPTCSLQPKSPDTESFYTYDAAKAQFHIALYSPEGVYEPFTESAKKEGDSVVLHVGYIPPTDPMRISSGNSDKPTPTKYMDYVIKTNDSTNSPYVYAVRKPAD